MSIISYIFLLLVFPAILLIYWKILRQPNQKLVFLFVVSYLFYALAGIEYVPILLGLSLATFWAAQRQYFGLGIVLNLLGLIVFKYWNFGADNLNASLSWLGLSNLAPVLHLALPLGISFYVFKHIGYLLDVKDNRYQATHDWLAFTTFSAFFPQISAGPISSFDDTGAQLRALPDRLTDEQTYNGLVYISMGLAKKLLIADTLGIALQSTLYASPHSGLVGAWSGVFLFALQIYFDFSGYTDLVLGFAFLLGVTLPPNFNNPYLAKNPGEFWQRWHISLSLWFRHYLFFPMSRSLLRRWGTRKSEQAQLVANMVTMLLIGVWHGAGWGFILWGGYHGVLLNISAWLNRRKNRYHLPAIPGLFFVLILISWAFFLSPDMGFTIDLLSNMIGVHGLGLSALATYDLTTQLTALIASALIVFGAVEAANLRRVQHRPIYLFFFGILAVLSIMHIERAIDFTYVQF